MSDIRKLVLLHNNDMHGAFLPETVDGKEVGGIARLSGKIKEIRDREKNTLFAIAGDIFRGSVIDSEFRGASTIELVNFLHPNIVSLGNHEVDYGLAHLLFLEKCARFPIVNANMYIKTNSARLFRPYQIFNVDGMNIMFIGVVTEEVLSSTRSEAVIGTFVDIWEACNQVGVIIDNYKTTKIDLTVLLTHIGFEEDKRLAAMLDPNWGIDIIIGGHTHTFMEKPCVINGIPIVQAGMGTSHLGRFDIDIDLDKHQMTGYNWQIVDINEDTAEADTVLVEVLETYKNQTDHKYQRIITTFRRKLTHPNRYEETELGNLVADLLQVDSSFDIMLFASGSIRLKEMGPVVTYEDLKNCLPFNAPVYMLEVNGRQLRQMMKYMLRDEALRPDSHTEFYQVSKGFRMVYDYLTKEFREFMLNGQEITDDLDIKIALQEYHLNNFREFFGLDSKEVYANKKPRMVITDDFSIFEELMAVSPQMDAQVEGRITILNRPS